MRERRLKFRAKRNTLCLDIKALAVTKQRHRWFGGHALSVRGNREIALDPPRDPGNLHPCSRALPSAPSFWGNLYPEFAQLASIGRVQSSAINFDICQRPPLPFHRQIGLQTTSTNTDPGKWHIRRFSKALCLSLIIPTDGEHAALWSTVELPSCPTSSL